MEWITAPGHDDHVARGRLAYEAYAEALHRGGPYALWDNLTESTRLGWLKAAGVAGHEALKHAADVSAKAGMPECWVDQLRADANDAICHRLLPGPDPELGP